MPMVDPWENYKPKSQAEINDLAMLVSILIYKSCKEASSEAPPMNNIFHGNSVPRISIADYIFRFVRAAQLNESELIGSLIILDRYFSYTQQSLNLFNVHRLIGIALIVAHKNFSDRPLKMVNYAHIYGVTSTELINIEKIFLHSIDFKLFTIPEHFLHYKNKLISLARVLARDNVDGVRLEPFTITMNDKEKRALCTSLFTINEGQSHNKVMSDTMLLVSSLISDKIVDAPPEESWTDLDFYYTSIPALSIKDYIDDLVSGTGADEGELIGVLILLDRYLSHPGRNLNYLNVHRLIAVAFVVAQKSFSDVYYVMSHYAKISSISLTRLLELEYTFISTIDFNVFVSREHFLIYKNKLMLRARELEATGYLSMSTEEEKAFYNREVPTISGQSDNTVRGAVENAENNATVHRELSDLSVVKPCDINETPNPSDSLKKSKQAEKKSTYSPRFSAKPVSTNKEHSLEAVRAPNLTPH